MKLDPVDKVGVFLVAVLLLMETAVAALLGSWFMLEAGCLIVGVLALIWFGASHLLIPWIERVP